MKKHFSLLLLMVFLISGGALCQPARMLPDITPAGKGRVNTRVDNIGYWSRMVQMGYVKANPKVTVPEAQFTGTEIRTYEQSAVGSRQSRVTRHSSRLQNSPDIPVTGEADVTQSENSIFIDPGDENTVLNSNNSSSWISGYAQDPYGADALYSFDNGENWAGSTSGINGANAGDPSTAIGLNGWWYVGRITADYGQSVSYSKDQGRSWKRVKVGQGPANGIGLLDKNHLCIDNSPSSPFNGYLYAGWTNFIPGNADTNQVEIVRSTDAGLTWSSPLNISAAASGLKMNHGVNIRTGPDGEVYAVWSIYDSWPSDETAIGFARSFNGGGVFMPATRIISNIKGIRATMTGKNMRVSSFPCMTVDNSMGPNRGTIYVVWSNVGFPGVNTGSDIDLYLIRSKDGGSSWSAPIRVNQDPAGLGKQHFLPWITSDPVTGGICVVYYDDRNVDSTQAAVFVSSSYDGGNTWTDMQVSDYTFTPEPIPGLAFSYFGDYIGIQSANMNVYPVWTDNRNGGRAMTYVSPFSLGPNPGQPWVTWYSDSLSTVSSLGDVTMNYGDSLNLSLGLKNIGDQEAAGVFAEISTNSPYVIIRDSTASYGSIGPGQVKTVPNGYFIKVSDTIPDNLLVRFDVKVAGTDSSWYSHFAIESHAPALKINGLTIIDTLDGNHNGRLDPGENVQIVIPVTNTGDFACPLSSARLTSSSPSLTLLTDSVFLDDLQPGQEKNAVFNLLVSADTPAGSGAELILTTHSGLYEVKRTFREMVGLIVEDWETNTFTKFPWLSGGAKPWVITSLNPWEGVYSLESGIIGDNQSSQLLLSYIAAADDSISFYLRTSTEQEYDFLMFYIDGVLQEQWSGETPWLRTAFPVAAGQHVFKWNYQKDMAAATGTDRAGIDFISLPPPFLASVDPGPDDTICAGSDAMLYATAQSYDSIRWTTLGDGVFTNDTALITAYSPGTNDLISGNVTLRLTGFSKYGRFGKNKHIRIYPLPVAAMTLFPNDTVCAGQFIRLAADTAGVAAWQWSPGNFTASEVTYDTAAAGGVGNHLIRLVVTNVHQCQSRDSVYLTFLNCAGIKENLPGSICVFPNPGDGVFSLGIYGLNPGRFRLSVTNVVNEVVYRENDVSVTNHFSKKINLTFLPDGVYLLSLSTAHETHSCKLIIRK